MAARIQIKSDLDEVVVRAIELNQKLIGIESTCILDVLEPSELLEFILDGRISVTETKDGEEPVLVCRSSWEGIYSIAYVFRSEEIYRGSDLTEAVYFFAERFGTGDDMVNLEKSYP